MEEFDILRGTVLGIPLRDRAWAVGQVLWPGVNFYLGIGVHAFFDATDPNLVHGIDLKLFSWTNDAEIYRGNWKILGVTSVKHIARYPEYRVFLHGIEKVESFQGNSWRDFDPDKDSTIGFRTVRSPVLVQSAVNAAHGYEGHLKIAEEMR